MDEIEGKSYLCLCVELVGLHLAADSRTQKLANTININSTKCTRWVSSKQQAVCEYMSMFVLRKRCWWRHQQRPIVIEKRERHSLFASHRNYSTAGYDGHPSRKQPFSIDHTPILSISTTAPAATSPNI